MNNEKNTIFCASCKHWTTSEPYLDDNDETVEYPVCGNIRAEKYNDYAPCDCQACELYEREE